MADDQLAGLLDAAGRIDDVEAADARLAQARALGRGVRLSSMPNIRVEVTGQAGAVQHSDGFADDVSGFVFRSPLDLNGATAARTQAAAARARASEADLVGARVTARRMAAQSYVAFRSFQNQRIAAERALANADDILQLTVSRAGAGLANDLAMAEATTDRDGARALIPGLRHAETAARYALEALLGLDRDGLLDRLSPPGPVPVISTERLVDAPVTVLTRRPDLLAEAERLEAAGLDARAAQADRFPTLSIGAFVNFADISHADQAVMVPKGLSALVSAGLGGNIFDFGRLEQMARAATAAARAEAIIYRKTARYALSDVDAQIDRKVRADQAVEAAQSALGSARNEAQIARGRYDSGLTSFLSVLRAENAVAGQERAVISAQAEAADAGVLLAAALGLGGDPPEVGRRSVAARPESGVWSGDAAAQTPAGPSASGAAAVTGP